MNCLLDCTLTEETNRRPRSEAIYKVQPRIVVPGTCGTNGTFELSELECNTKEESTIADYGLVSFGGPASPSTVRRRIVNLDAPAALGAGDTGRRHGGSRYGGRTRS
ncbi:hypothetical protein EVAR_63577_1 [Eumeta japonica]|uniref:Uncharacterized protein n=1 Tax=Eumeta variegata TaxID=151549 RepID=A0A4C1ZRY7_EUMVA|nr:hypothetical protein EVAR_63577_1 [Eumeta japonica]